MSAFVPLDPTLRTALVEARLQLHYAAQLPAAAARALVPPEDDDSHTSLAVLEKGARLVGRPTETEAPARVGLDVPSLSVLVMDEALIPIATHRLAERSFAESLAWLGAELSRCTGEPEPALALPDYDLPSHDLASEGRFDDREGDLRAELGRWFGNAAYILELVRAAQAAAGPVLLWPHHFDVATLVSLGDGQSINVGFSPGDGTYPEPYWYVSPWPHPADPSGEQLAEGHWHTAGFVAAILLGGIDQDQVESFMESAIEASRRLLRGD